MQGVDRKMKNIMKKYEQIKKELFNLTNCDGLEMKQCFEKLSFDNLFEQKMNLKVLDYSLDKQQRELKKNKTRNARER